MVSFIAMRVDKDSTCTYIVRMPTWTPKGVSTKSYSRIPKKNYKFKGPGCYGRRRDAGLCPRCESPPVVKSLCLDCWFAARSSDHLGTRSFGPELKALWKEQGGRCAYTGEELTPGDGASLDHKIPRTGGGEASVDNLQWISYKVNRMKTDMTEDEFLETCRSILSYRKVLLDKRAA